MLEVVDMARELADLPEAIHATAQALQAKLERKCTALKASGKTAAQVDKATVNMQNRTDEAFSHLAYLRDRELFLTNESERAAAAGNPWPLPGQLPTHPATRADPKKFIEEYTAAKAADIMQKAASGKPM
jgi:hypothetical protein